MERKDKNSMKSLSTYTFPIFFEEWNLDIYDITSAWENKGNIVIRIGLKK